jgi:2-methylcitrate dehydratase PrpD
MGTVLGLVAYHGYAGVTEFEQGFNADSIAAFRDNVTMALDAEVDAAYPARWIGKVTVTTTDGHVFHGRVDEPKGDPGNTLSRDEIATKLHRLAAFSGAATEGEAARVLGNAWKIAGQTQVEPVFDAQADVAVSA